MRLSYCNCSPNSNRDVESHEAAMALDDFSRSESRDNTNELMSQGTINIDHSRLASAGETSISLFSP